MLQYARSVPSHRWLFGLAIALIAAAPFHVLAVFANPTGLLNLHLISAAGVGIFAELRRQWSVHMRGRDELARLVSSRR